ncbi:MAG: hypothetical protein PSX81_14345 [bacterium]|nr:hypothetical protein [bacterium]
MTIGEPSVIVFLKSKNKDKLNIRLDQGFGKKNQNGFHLDVAEAI